MLKLAFEETDTNEGGGTPLIRKSQIVALFLVIQIVAASTLLLGQFQSPGDPMQPKPYLKSPGYSGPPLSTALPTSFSRGLQMPVSKAPTGTPIGAHAKYGGPGGGYLGRRSAFPTATVNHPYVPPRNYLGMTNYNQWIRNTALQRGMTRGLRF